MQAALDQPVLVLNRLWQAVNVIGARRAFALLARGHAQVVHQTADNFRTFSLMDWVDFSAYNPPVEAVEAVHTVNRVIRLPRVILLTLFDKLPCKELKLTRNNVFERDGKTTWENIVCSCVPCNTRKANRLPHEAHMRLLRKPVRPKWRPVISLVLGNHGREKWKDFLDVAYWNVELEE